MVPAAGVIPAPLANMKVVLELQDLLSVVSCVGGDGFRVSPLCEIDAFFFCQAVVVRPVWDRNLAEIFAAVVLSAPPWIRPSRSHRVALACEHHSGANR